MKHASQPPAAENSSVEVAIIPASDRVMPHALISAGIANV